MRPTPPDGCAGVTVRSDDVSDTAVPKASKAHVKLLICSIFCDATMAETVIDLASAFMRSVCREIPASATVAAVARAVATKTSIREAPRSTKPAKCNPRSKHKIKELPGRSRRLTKGIRIFATGNTCEA